MCKFFILYEESLHLGVCKLAKYVRTALFSGKIYTSDKNFTRPPVATNSKSVLGQTLTPLSRTCIFHRIQLVVSICFDIFAHRNIALALCYFNSYFYLHACAWIYLIRLHLVSLRPIFTFTPLRAGGLSCPGGIFRSEFDASQNSKADRFLDNLMVLPLELLNKFCL